MRRVPLLLLALATPTLAAHGPPPAAASPPRAGGWRPPVPGAVARPFRYGRDPFRRGWHRGADFAAPAGATVRAACPGVVVTARAGGPGGGVVTLRCGPWRVTHLPLATVTVRAGARVPAGARVGTLAAGAAHAGLHLGVRREGDPFGYVDPLPFLGGPGGPAPVAPPRMGPPGEPPRPIAAPPLRPAGGRVRVPRARALAPWPAWAGLALLLSGAVGGGVRWRVRRRRAPASVAVPRGVA